MKSVFWKNAWRLIIPYWLSEEKYGAICRLLLLLAFATILVRLQVVANDLVRELFDAIQKVHGKLIAHYAWQYIGIILLVAFLAAINIYILGALVNRWRRWLTHHYLDQWLSTQAYYRMHTAGEVVDNPDQRIADDIQTLASSTLSLFTNLYRSLLQLVTFIVILWQLSGSLKFTVGQHTMAMPGYLVWCVIAYAIINTLITLFIGRKLSYLDYQQQHYNADFRFNLIRLREYGEQIALSNGDSIEQQHLKNSFKPVFDNFMRALRVQVNLAVFENATSSLAGIIGILFALPVFLQKQQTLGDLMQMSSSFGYVYDSLSYIISAYTSIAIWQAVIARLTELTEKIGATQQKFSASLVQYQTGNSLQLQSLRIHYPHGSTLQQNLSWHITEKEKVLITGASGSGKSTLFRTIAKLWPYAQGNIILPKGIMFLPQKPYLQPVSLLETICFPSPAAAFDQTEVMQLLGEVELAKLIPLLNEKHNWHHELSLGEQQRVAIVRAILHKPNWLFLDEATASMDEALERKIYQLLYTKLPEATIISIGHRNSLRALHDRCINFS